MKVLMALSGRVDSSVAAAELLGDGHEVVGIPMRLCGWQQRHRLLLGGRCR